MKYMVVETFKPGRMEEVYARFREKGRMLPDGLQYIDSWLTVDRAHCFQLMETEDPALFDVWTACWRDLVDFEVVPVDDSPTKAGTTPD